MRRKLLMLLYSLIGLIKAWSIKSSDNIGKIALPEVKTAGHVSKSDLVFLIRQTRRTLRVGGVPTERKCFFRSYIIASILRKFGVSAKMNVGLKIVGTSSKTEGHCWVTTEDGRPVAEASDPRLEYPKLVGSGVNGTLYWINLD